MNSGLPGILGVDVRQTILDFIPWKKTMTVDEITDFVKDHYKFTPESKLKNLPSLVKKELMELSAQGILNGGGICQKIGKIIYWLEFEYLAGR